MPGKTPIPANAAVTPSIEIGTMRWAVTANGNRSGYNATLGTVIMLNNAEQPVATFVNPADSGVDVYLHRVVLGASRGGEWRRYRNPVVNGPFGDPRPNVNRGGGGDNSKARLYSAWNTVATGGTEGIVVFTGPTSDFVDQLDGTIIMRPGETMRWTYLPVPLGHTDTRVSLQVVWWEEPAAS
jgi:hypothetical protein